MVTIIRWVAVVGLFWFFAFMGLQAIGFVYPERQSDLNAINLLLLGIGQGLGKFIAPVLQLAMVVLILLYGAEKLGFLKEGHSGSWFSHISTANNIQAFIAIVIVVALAISALGGIGDIATLKDLALVVVGFYFGTKRKQDTSSLE